VKTALTFASLLVLNANGGPNKFYGLTIFSCRKHLNGTFAWEKTFNDQLPFDFQISEFE
jgi:hypothetical protein